MEKQLQQHLNEAFAPYGDFPARADVMQELLANLEEKYRDLKARSKSDDEAYQAYHRFDRECRRNYGAGPARRGQAQEARIHPA